MGVRGLLTYLKKHPEGRCRSVSLYTVARKMKDETGKTPKLICDFLNIFFWLMSEFHEAKVKCKDYQTYSCLYGGDINEYAERFIAFVRILRRVGVDPIFFLDGERGSDLEGFMAKLETYQKRHDGRIENCRRLIKYDPKHQRDTTHPPWVKPPLLGMQILMALKAEGVIVEHCNSEADECMAQYARDQAAQGDICGILTNDTDLVMMRGLEVFPCDFFDREAKLGIRSPTFNGTATDIIYESVTPDTLARVLNLPQDDLANLSIICGNDYTKGLNMSHDLVKRLNFTERRRPVIENMAEWLRTTPHMPLHETSPLKEICEKTNGKYKEAIDRTYQAYTQNPPATGDQKRDVESDDVAKKKCHDSPHYDMIHEGVRNLTMMRDLLPMAANSIYWRSVVVEDVDDSVTPPLKCIYDLLLSIRQLVYISCWAYKL